MPRLNRLLFKSGSKGQAGFTLIEVLVALTIFAIGLLALAGMQVTGIRGNAQAHSVMAKVALADGVLEEFLAMDPSDAIFDTAANFVAWRAVTVSGAGNLVADVDVIIDDVTYPGLAQIEVTVAGQGPDVVKTVMKRRR